MHNILYRIQKNLIADFLNEFMDSIFCKTKNDAVYETLRKEMIEAIKRRDAEFAAQRVKKQKQKSPGAIANFFGEEAQVVIFRKIGIWGYQQNIF